MPRTKTERLENGYVEGGVRVGGDQRFWFDHARFIFWDKAIKRALRSTSREFSGRIRTEDANMGVSMKMIIIGIELRLWIGEGPGAFQHWEGQAVKPPARDTKKATLERGEKPEECGGQGNDRRNMF